MAASLWFLRNAEPRVRPLSLCRRASPFRARRPSAWGPILPGLSLAHQPDLSSSRPVTIPDTYWRRPSVSPGQGALGPCEKPSFPLLAFVHIRAPVVANAPEL